VCQPTLGAMEMAAPPSVASTVAFIQQADGSYRCAEAHAHLFQKCLKTCEPPVCLPIILSLIHFAILLPDDAVRRNLLRGSSITLVILPCAMSLLIAAIAWSSVVDSASATTAAAAADMLHHPLR
jgi:hypothetical protein